MASTDSDPEDAITKDEIAGAEPAPPAPHKTGISHGTKRNAFTELMSPKTKVPAASTTIHHHLHKARDGLRVYTDAPETFPGSRVIFYDADFVAIHDLYPKASVHALLLPRSPALRGQHPFDAFGCRTPESAAALAAARERAARLKGLVAKELQRRFGGFSAQDARREAVLNGDGGYDGNSGGRQQEEEKQAQPQPQPQPPQGEDQKGEEKEKEKDKKSGVVDDDAIPPLPPGRDWEAEVLVGVHAHPSMNDLHVHVVSRDMRSGCLKHRRHYNSFQTPFLVPLDDFPLAADDPRRSERGYLRRDLRCWRCGRDFGNRFQRLKEHLEAEFEEWKRE